ncbi:MAG: acetyl-CoA carboxylase carboxyl transferase subunit alpha [Candidatus Marinimicrobia bacterium]|nr:acetyl-CoA carboxylase carboxyl transferase subunit alpha [Candidatus Neomarinimicrobiota bacterium]
MALQKYYLEFEKPIEEIDQRIQQIESTTESTPESLNQIAILNKERTNIIDTLSMSLSRWQRVQLARHPERPFSLDYINHFSNDFIELHGDRYFGDDPAIVSGIGTIGDRKVVWIGQQKGRTTKENLYRNFGMMRPEGYRKAIRVMKLGEKFNLPIVTLIDTIGAYPGIGAEERGQGEAIAKNLMEMAKLKTNIISVIIGEGASGGALGIGLCDRFYMLENTWYSVISPEGCASILYRDAKKASEAAESLMLAPKDLKNIKICDEIISEPNGGAHRDFGSTAKNLKEIILKTLNDFDQEKEKNYLDKRIEKYDKLGFFKE